MDKKLTYRQFIIKHNSLLCDSLRPRMPWETADQWARERIKAEQEMAILEKKYPEFYQKYKSP